MAKVLVQYFYLQFILRLWVFLVLVEMSALFDHEKAKFRNKCVAIPEIIMTFTCLFSKTITVRLSRRWGWMGDHGLVV